MAKRKKAATSTAPRMFADGDPVLILRPEPLWSGSTGIVEGFVEGRHRVRVFARNQKPYPASFQVDIAGDLLEIYL